MDYYKVLGVEKSASQDEIKKAFRKKAHEFHPDKKTGNADKFKEINEAYQVLGDEQKRKQYDTFGSSGPQSGYNWQNAQQGGFQGTNFDFGDLGDIFGDMFGFGGRGQRTARGSDIRVEVEITFEEAYFGAEKTIRLYKSGTCDTCKGSGAKKGSKVEQCTTCQGRGKVRRVQNTMLGAIQVEASCSACDGRGEKVADPCKDCSGSGVKKVHEEFSFKVPPGIAEGQSIRFREKGEAAGKGLATGDLYITFRLKESNVFKREGNNILVDVDVPFTTLALGGTISVPTVEGSVRLKVPAGTKSGKVFSLKNKGFENIAGRGRGDQLITVNVVVPDKLSKKQKELLEQLELEFKTKKKSWF